MARPALFLAAAILVISLAWSSSALVSLVLFTGTAVLLLAAFRFPRQPNSMTTTSPAIQVARLATVGVVAVLALLIVLFLLMGASCPPAGCV
jgi:hypothetical protein